VGIGWRPIVPEPGNDDQGYPHFVVPDTSFYIEHEDKLEDVDFGPLIDVWQSTVRYSCRSSSWMNSTGSRRARIRTPDGALATPWPSWTVCSRTPPFLARLRAGDVVPGPDGLTRSEITIELVFDPSGHVRLPINDDEIIDRALAIEPLADRKVSLLTYDTGQFTRARSAGYRSSS